MKKLNQIGVGTNAYTFSFDERMLAGLREVYESVIASGMKENSELRPLLFKGNGTLSADVDILGYRFSIRSYGITPILSVSNSDTRSYDLFRNIFEALDIKDDVKQLVPYQNDITLYSGFFEISDHLDEEAWREDYYKGAHAYTLITPLFGPSEGHGNLLYKDSDSNVHSYTFKPGEAIMFGDEFEHSSETYGHTDEVRVLLGLSFGTDKLDSWDILKQTMVTQTDFYMLPCGHQVGTCNCLQTHQ